MKVIKILLSVVVLVFGAVYVAVFTPLNKTTIVPIIKSNIVDATKIKDVQIPQFDLSLSSLKLKLLLNNQPIVVDAKFSIVGQTLDAIYDINIADLSLFNDVSGQILKGSFQTNGKLAGTFKNLDLKGMAKVAKGDIDYKLNINDNQPNNIKVIIQSLDLSTLLMMVNQPSYVYGKFNANATISSANLEDVKVNAAVQKGKFNVVAFQKNLKLNIPKSNFTLDTKVNLQNKAGDFNFNFNSQLIRLLTSGQVDINSLNVDSKYKILIEQLAMLEPIIGSKFNGSFQTNGTIKGDKASMLIDGKTNLAKGNTTYKVNLKNLAVDSIIGKMRQVKVDKLLYMVNQPRYAKANLDADFKIVSLSKLKGDIKTKISNGYLNQILIKKDFDIALPKNATFKLNTNTKLDNNLVTTNANLTTFAANLVTKKTIFNIKDTSLNTDYTLSVPNLAKLFFITQQKLRGKIKIVGDVKFKKDVNATFNSKQFGGEIKGSFVKDKLQVKANKVKLLEVLHMLYYPEIFKSTANIALDYNVTSEKGTSTVDMNNGQFLPNQLSQTIKKLIKKDLTTEIYKVVDIKTNINSKVLDSKLNMESKNSKITSNNIHLDLNKQYLNSKFDIRYYKYDLGVKAEGNISSPKIKIDTGKLLKSKAKDKIKKALDKKLKGDLGGLIKGLF